MKSAVKPSHSNNRHNAVAKPTLSYVTKANVESYVTKVECSTCSRFQLRCQRYIVMNVNEAKADLFSYVGPVNDE